MNASSLSEIAIVGAGFSGTLVAAHLLRQARTPLTIHLIDRDPQQFGRGVAYSSTLGCHLLNVPAANMSAFPDQPQHFLRWAEAREASLLDPPWVTEIGPTSFLPRRAYGDYLCWLLDEAERAAAAGVRLERWIDKARGLTLMPEGVVLELASGVRLRVAKAVLALGNFPPGNPPVADPGFYRSARYHRNPWRPGVLTALLETESCLLIGSGLTMVDWAITLNQAGYRGTIHIVSRRGLWPKPHRLGPPAACAIDPERDPPSVRVWLRAIRRHSEAGDWRAVIDALRPHNQTLWQRLPPAEQRRFLRHLRPFWDLHRHRVAPVVAERLQALAESGQVVRHVGRIRAYRESGDGVTVSLQARDGGRPSTLRVQAVVNCSGSESNYRRLESALVRDLLGRGLVRPDALALGLEAGPEGALVGADGTLSDRLFTLGPPKKGLLWETTAVPEVRVQAARLAAFLLGEADRR
ncbi:FAD/NAD(P)-binding protein [Candidatus Methylocalor cossyra]|uniref:Hydroxyacylglutathione hydrolase n=1 Tax=Candidatus Methylocalor cossyra TaxID=3108543 RepID=A0ABM9NMD5_9GAMM